MLVKRSYAYDRFIYKPSTVWIESNTTCVTGLTLETDHPILAIDFAYSERPYFICLSCTTPDEAKLLTGFTKDFFGISLTDLCKRSYDEKRKIPLGNYRYFILGRANEYLKSYEPVHVETIDELS